MTATGLLLIRLMFGLTFAAHGSQKLLGWFGGPGLKGAAAMFESLGVKPGLPMAFLAALGELVSGLAFAAGFATPIAGVIMAAVMVGATFTVTGKQGFWILNGGAEYTVSILAVAVGVALIGAGRYSLDHVIGWLGQ